MDDREMTVVPDDDGYEPPAAEDLDTAEGPSASAAGVTQIIGAG